jgi:AcrR family transcriptional regulator
MGIDINLLLMSTTTDMKTTRSYTMTARAEAVEGTRHRIREALFELGTTRMFTEISLEDVAREADVSVQTVLRHYGSRAALIESNIEYALEVLMDHYELRGDTVMLMLAQEETDEQVHRLTDSGRQMHRDWVQSTFASVVAGRDDVTDLLVVATDIYTWKLLRRDRGHSRATTEQRMKALVRAVTSDAEKRD